MIWWICAGLAGLLILGWFGWKVYAWNLLRALDWLAHAELTDPEPWYVRLAIRGSRKRNKKNDTKSEV